MKAYCVFNFAKKEIAKDICGQFVIKPLKRECLDMARRWNRIRGDYSVRQLNITFNRRSKPCEH